MSAMSSPDSSREPADTVAAHHSDDIPRNDSQAAFRRFLEVTLRLCNAGSAGLSRVRLNKAGQTIIRWEAISGALASHEGNEMSRDFSPCGQCLDISTTTILPDPQRVFSFLGATIPRISEEMIVPLYDHLKAPIGTLWLAHHDASHFSVADVELAQRLALLLEQALSLCDKEEWRRMPLPLLESHETERRSAARELAAERRQREHADASASKLREALGLANVEIRDAHHRVKNTLQIAANFLHLQASKSTSPETRNALEEGRGRLNLLANVHRLLYRGSDEARQVPMRDLLQMVAEALEVSFLNEAAPVQLRMAIEPIMLAAQDAIPLALLVNEAVTNAYKHAFSGRSGDITVSLQRTASQALLLQIQDNGIGLSMRTVKSSMGLELIHAFAAQLGGVLVLSSPADSSGTTLTLSFPYRAESQETSDSSQRSSRSTQLDKARKPRK